MCRSPSRTAERLKSLRDSLGTALPERRKKCRKCEKCSAHSSARHPCQPSCEQKDRKSTRLNSSHQIISYAVFCLKKKKTTYAKYHRRQVHPKSSLCQH